MKKFMMCLLSLTVILSGCVQQEQPEEPPVVDKENEKLPDENLEENKNDNDHEDEDIEDKTGSDEDSEQSKIEYRYPFKHWTEKIETENYSSYTESTGKIYEDKEYLVIKKKEYLGDEGLSEYSTFNYSDSELYNWLTTFDLGNQINEHLYLNLNGEFADELNSYFAEYNEMAPGGFVSSKLAGWQETNDDILSVILRMRSSGNGQVFQGLQVYNIDLETNKPLTNIQLLEKFGYTVEQAQLEVYKQLEDFGVQSCIHGEDENLLENCYYKDQVGDITFLYSIYLNSYITNDSVLFINEYDELNMIVYVSNPEVQFYNGNKENYFIIKF